MGALLKIVDEHWGVERKREAAAELRLVSERISPREIIRQRVLDELKVLNARVQDHNRARSFLVDARPDGPERLLNSKPKLRLARLFDPSKEVTRAIQAFEKRRFIMLLDERQIDDLDQEVAITQDCEVVFLFLTPLRGG